MEMFKNASATPLSRRAVLGAGLFGAAMLASPSIRRASAEENALYVNTWGGDWEASVKKFLFEPFTADTGIEIRTVSPISFAKLAAQKTTGVYEFDVTTLGVADVARQWGGPTRDAGRSRRHLQALGRRHLRKRAGNAWLCHADGLQCR